MKRNKEGRRNIENELLAIMNNEITTKLSWWQDSNRNAFLPNPIHSLLIFLQTSSFFL